MNIKVGDYVRSSSTGQVYRVSGMSQWGPYTTPAKNCVLATHHCILLTDVEVLEAKLKGLVYGE